MKHRLFLSIAAASVVLGGMSFAGSIGPVISSKDCTWVGSIAAGPVWTRGGATQTLFLVPEIEKTYAVRKSTNALASGELFLGMQKSWPPQWVGQLGLVVATTGNATFQGMIWDDGDPQFDNYRSIQNTKHSCSGQRKASAWGDALGQSGRSDPE
ncbi:hypothetical protein [Legionella sp. W10-070]|uniref:hypothetical protein n=1 Tax=unclassified Legionella TaxID=2622702 RepID=UPI003242F1EB